MQLYPVPKYQRDKNSNVSGKPSHNNETGTGEVRLTVVARVFRASTQVNEAVVGCQSELSARASIKINPFKSCHLYADRFLFRQFQHPKRVIWANSVVKEDSACFTLKLAMNLANFGEHDVLGCWSESGQGES